VERNSPVNHERADARRNREKIVRAARRVLAERGGIAPLGEIARQAGVGTGTLYRRFPGRASLVRAVALDVIRAVSDEVEAAMAEETEGFAMIRRYMSKALEVRIGAVMPALLDHAEVREELLPVRNRLTARVETMVARAQAEGSLRSEVTAGDLGMLIVRLSRPLPGGIPPDLDDELARRHLDIVLAGLLTTPELGSTVVTGPALDIPALRRMTQETR
jgi:AcrR family transcriptional regulator